MYSGSTQIYFRKTVGHAFTKLAQMVGTTIKKNPSKLFLIVVHISTAMQCECM
jgi:hypothetical protein